jgi:hypothetical protein
MTIRATYENGVFRPIGDVDLPERCEVEFGPKRTEGRSIGDEPLPGAGPHDGDASWMAGVNREWDEEWDDPREDIYTLNDGEPVRRDLHNSADSEAVDAIR